MSDRLTDEYEAFVYDLVAFLRHPLNINRQDQRDTAADLIEALWAAFSNYEELSCDASAGDLSPDAERLAEVHQKAWARSETDK